MGGGGGPAVRLEVLKNIDQRVLASVPPRAVKNSETSGVRACAPWSKPSRFKLFSLLKAHLRNLHRW